MKPKRVGILGGMGPEATAFFFQKIIELTPARRDQDHIPLIIFNNPQVPDRTAAIMGHGESPLPILLEGITFLEGAGVDFICIPCNTAHFYYEELQNRCRVPILHLIDEVVKQVQEHGDVNKIGILATTGTLKSGLYQKACQKLRIKTLTPDATQESELYAVIQNIKAGKKVLQPVIDLVNAFLQQGVQGIILGCTELSLIKEELAREFHLPIFDSVEILARRAVQLALS